LSHGADRRTAALIVPTMEYVCGKLPHISPVTGWVSSDSRPRWLRLLSITSKISRACALRPMRASASMRQKVQMLNAVSGLPKSSAAS
jgi:hypothetical protein